MKLWRWLLCLTGHDPRFVTKRREGAEVVIVTRCKRCGKRSETKYREQRISARQ